MNIERAAQHLSRFGESQQDLAQEGYLWKLLGGKPGRIYGAMIDYNRAAKAPGWGSSRNKRPGSGWWQINEFRSPSGIPTAGNIAMRVDVHRAIGQLGKTAREAIRLRYFDGLNCPEVDRTLGLGAGAAAACLFKARARMREFLQSGYEVQSARFDGRSKKGRAQAGA